MIQPMSRPPRPNQPLQLVRFDPDKFADAFVAPDVQAFTAEFHGAAGDPEENEAVVLEFGDGHLPHFVVVHGSVRQLETRQK
jgi:hypothetical protein